MGFLDDPTDPSALENLRRSIAMLNTGQTTPLDRERALVLLEELQRLQAEHRDVTVQLRAILDRLEHPSNRRVEPRRPDHDAPGSASSWRP